MYVAFDITMRQEPIARDWLNYPFYSIVIFTISLQSNFYRNIGNRYPLINNFDNNGKTLFTLNTVSPHIYRLTAAYIQDL